MRSVALTVPAYFASSHFSTSSPPPLHQFFAFAHLAWLIINSRYLAGVDRSQHPWKTGRCSVNSYRFTYWLGCDLGGKSFKIVDDKI